MTVVLQLLWLALPIIAAGLVHLAVMKLDLLPGLRRLPLDGGRSFRGKRLFGDTGTKRPLRLVDSRTVGEGVGILVYQPANASGE